MSVSIIIPQRGHQERLTEPLVASIKRWEPEAEILIIDDGTGRHASPREIEGVRMIPNEGRGLTAAWNRGCQRASGDFLILLNNDVECSGPFAKKLISRAGIGIAGVTMRADPELGIHVLEGWCLAFARAVYTLVSGFDERFHLYFSDTDFQYRAHKAGHVLTAVPVPTLRHLGHRTAHDRKILKNQKELWQADHREFCQKWEIE